MAALQCRQCNEPVVLEGSAFWAEPSGANPRKCGKCGADLQLQGDLPDAEPGEVEELGDETFSALSSGIIDTKRPGANGAAERAAEAEAFARALIRAQLMDAVSDAPPSSRDEEVTVVIGPMSTRAKRAALAKMAAEREAAATAAQEPTLATTPSDELLEMSSPDASDRITSDRITAEVSSVTAGQNSTETEERRLPAPPARPLLPLNEEALEEIEAAPVSDGGTPSLQALIGHPVALLPHGVKQTPVLDKSRVPKPPERHQDEAIEDEAMVESVDLASVEATDEEDSDRASDSDVRAAEGGEIPTLAPTNVTAPPPALANAAAASRSRWATPLSFAALGSLFAVILAMRTPKATEESVAEQSAPPAAVAAARAPADEAPNAERAAGSLVEQQGTSSVEPVPPATGLAPVENEPPAGVVEAAAVSPAGAPSAAAAAVAPAAVKPRARPKRAEATEPFDASAANASLAQAQSRASSCRKADDPSGVAQVTITFAPSGRVTTALVAGPPFAGTQTGGCVASTLRSARVPPFLGDPVTVRKTVTIQ